MWTRSRYVSLADPSLDIGRYLTRKPFRDAPTNELLIKLHYWLRP